MNKKTLYIYIIGMLICYILYNYIFKNILIGGVLYRILMILLIIFNSIHLIQNKEHIDNKVSIIIVIYIFMLFSSRNLFQFLFNLSNIIILIIIEKQRKLFTKTSLYFIVGSIYFFSFLVLLRIPSLVKNYKSDFTRLEPKRYYKCKNNMEAYIISLPSINGNDEYYYIGSINNILDINYFFIINTNTKEVNYNEFYNYIDNINNQCFKNIDKYSNH